MYVFLIRNEKLGRDTRMNRIHIRHDKFAFNSDNFVLLAFKYTRITVNRPIIKFKSIRILSVYSCILNIAFFDT